MNLENIVEWSILAVPVLTIAYFIYAGRNEEEDDDDDYFMSGLVDTLSKYLN